MQYSKAGVKHKFSTGIIFEDDRKTYGWNCTNFNSSSDIVKIQEDILASFIKTLRTDETKNPLLIYE
ncbi:MAG: hypothetical protein ACFE8L_11290 [Candidatus Hodarchaeota archaeon]